MILKLNIFELLNGEYIVSEKKNPKSGITDLKKTS
jgi:hypothetical protein